MNGNRQALIDDLVDDLTPVARTRLPVVAGAWFLASWAWVIGATLVMGPIRPGALGQLVSVPHFGLETLAGFSAGALVTWAGFSGTIPGAARRPITLLAIVLTGAWVASHVLGLVAPALEPSTLGKRPYCVFETFIYAVPPMVAALWIARRRYVTRGLRTAVLLGLAAGMMPALFMQIACMYVPSHIIVFHLLPGGLVGLIGAVGALWLSPRKNRA